MAFIYTGVGLERQLGQVVSICHTWRRCLQRKHRAGEWFAEEEVLESAATAMVDLLEAGPPDLRRMVATGLAAGRRAKTRKGR